MAPQKPLYLDAVCCSSDPEVQGEVKSILAPLTLTDERVHQVATVFEDEMRRGLSRNPEERKRSSLQMENTFVTKLLNGKEEGQYLALDLGGTNFRVLLCTLKDGKCDSFSRNYNVPDEKLCGTIAVLFDHIAESIKHFINENNLTGARLPLGFTFSFPMEQKSIRNGVLLTWTKSFKITDGVGDDAVRHLEDAIRRCGGLPVDVVAVVNDTTGTLMAGDYLDKQCRIGIILGTGSNACYVEHTSQVEKWMDAGSCEKTVVDIEWGAFGDNGVLDFIKTEFDLEVDKYSNHVNSFTFEKLFAGMYMGELVRLVLLKLSKEKLLFGGKVTEEMDTRWKFLTKYVSMVEKDNIDGGTKNTVTVLDEMGLSSVASEQDIKIVQFVCHAISHRAAQLISACISILLRHIKESEVTIAIDGSLYKYHPRLHNSLCEMLDVLVPETKCKLILAEDGSGIGAALVAAVACTI